MNAHLTPDQPQSLKGAPAETLRPLSAIAATRRGLVPQARIARVLTDLAAPLAQLHAEGTVHGAISYDTVALDAQGEADIAAAPAVAPRSLGNVALAEGRASGYNAFEQYTDDPDWAIGPWTDVYALGAVACVLITGAPPPSAIDRCVRDTFVPLSARELEHYSPAFLAGIDHALALRPEDRPATMAALFAALGHPMAAAGIDTGLPVDAVARQPHDVAHQASGPADVQRATAAPPPPAAVPFGMPAHHWHWHSWLFVPVGLGLALLTVYLWLSWSNPFIPRMTDAALPLEPLASGRAQPYVPPEPPDLQTLAPRISILGPQALGLMAAAAGSDVSAGPSASPQAAAEPVAAVEPAVEAEPAPARVAVAIDVHPWGVISINGTRRGVSPPLRSLNLAPGTYRVTITNPGAASYSTRITVRPQGPAPVIRHQF